MKKVLFVCLGNICRSPTAEGVFRKIAIETNLADQFEIDSVGTGGWHIDHPPDRRATEAAALRGIDLSMLRARQVTVNDIAEFDYIIAMDNQNLIDLKSISNPTNHSKIELLMKFSNKYDELEVPDPYYGAGQGFTQVLDMIKDAAHGLLRAIQSENA